MNGERAGSVRSNVSRDRESYAAAVSCSKSYLNMLLSLIICCQTGITNASSLALSRKSRQPITHLLPRSASVSHCPDPSSGRGGGRRGKILKPLSDVSHATSDIKFLVPFLTPHPCVGSRQAIIVSTMRILWTGALFIVSMEALLVSCGAFTLRKSLLSGRRFSKR